MRLFTTICLLAALVLLTGPLLASPVCGGVSDWVNTCLAGTDVFSSKASVTVLDAFHNVLFADLDLFDNSTTIYRSAGSGGFITTEMVALTLTGSGVTVRAGDGLGNLASDNPLHSPGFVQQQAGDPMLADSFFDIFFELDYGPLTLHNFASDAGPHLSMHAVIGFIPPIGAIYEPKTPELIPLYMGTNPNPVAYLEHASHTVTPEPGSFLLVACGVSACLLARRRRRSRLG